MSARHDSQGRLRREGEPHRAGGVSDGPPDSLGDVDRPDRLDAGCLFVFAGAARSNRKRGRLFGVSQFVRPWSVSGAQAQEVAEVMRVRKVHALKDKFVTAPYAVYRISPVKFIL